jgi:nicotinamidase-related amidase
VRDALIVIDVLSDFRHEDGAALLRSFRRCQPALRRAIADARGGGVPVIYVNDSHGSWDWDTRAWMARILERSSAAALIEHVGPRPGDTFLRKARYSAFDHTPLEIVLRELETERVLLAGAATEMCVVQTAIDARELGITVTILAAACASVDERNEETALAYAERVVGARVERGANEA